MVCMIYLSLNFLKLLLLPYKPQTFGLYEENLKTRFVALPLRPHSSLISSYIIVLVAKI